MRIFRTLVIAATAFGIAGQGSAVGFVGSSPSADQIEAYVKLQEFHFELRLADSDRSKFATLVGKDAADGKLREGVAQAPDLVKKLTSGDYLGMAAWHREQRNIDSIEISTEGMLGNGQVYGRGIWAQARRDAANGVASAKFLLERKGAYEEPLRGSGNIFSSLFQRQMDASYEWTAIRLALITKRKLWDGTAAHRARIQKAFLATWDQAGSANKQQASLIDWHNQNVWDWIIWRLGDYRYLARMTPYSLRAQIAEWGASLVVFLPKIKPDVVAREKELRDYVAKMAEVEIRSEFERMRKADARFQEYLQQQQHEMMDANTTVAAMRKGMIEFHVANLNISENAASTGFRWTISDH